MRRIGILLSAVFAFALVQGCSTTDQDASVGQKPGQASAQMESSAHSSKGSGASADTVKVDLSKRAAAKPAPKPAAAPPPPKKEVVKTEPKPAPAPKKEAVKAEPKPAPVAPKKEAPKKEVAAKPAPAPKPVAPPKPAKPAEESEVSAMEASPHSSKSGETKTGTVAVNLTKAPEPAPVMKEAAPTAKKETVKPAPTPKPAAAPKEIQKPKEVALAKSGQGLGMVRQVNNEYKFIVIEFESEKELPAGTELQIWRKGKLVGRARLDPPPDPKSNHWPLGVATLVEGTPEKEDTVTQ